MDHGTGPTRLKDGLETRQSNELTLHRPELTPSTAGTRDTERRTEIAIVGAGLAGLVAAKRLGEAGAAPHVYEASYRSGGRIMTEREPRTGQVFELGGEFIDSNNERLLVLLEELGLEKEDLYVEESVQLAPVFFLCGAPYDSVSLDAGLSPIRAAARHDASVIGHSAASTGSSEEALALDRLSARDWIDSRVPGGIETPLGHLLDVAYTMESGAETSDLSAIVLLSMLGDEQSKSTLGLFGASDERYCVRGGVECIIHGLTRELTRDVQFGHRLVSAATDRNSVRLTFDVEGRAREVVANHVVITIPFTTLRSVDLTRLDLSDLKRTAIAELGMGVNVKLFLEFAAPYWRALDCSGETYSDIGYQCTWQKSSSGENDPAILVNYRGGKAALELEKLSADQAARRFLSQIEPVLPGISQWWTGRALLGTWSSSPFSKGSYSYSRLGQLTMFNGIEGTAEGRVHFAGEHTCHEFRGYMEGAVRSGERVATEVLQARHSQRSG